MSAQDGFCLLRIRLCKMTKDFPLGQFAQIFKTPVPCPLEERAWRPPGVDQGQNDSLEGRPVEFLKLRQRHESVRSSVKGHKNPFDAAVSRGGHGLYRAYSLFTEHIAGFKKLVGNAEHVQHRTAHTAQEIGYHVEGRRGHHDGSIVAGKTELSHFLDKIGIPYLPLCL